MAAFVPALVLGTAVLILVLIGLWVARPNSNIDLDRLQRLVRYGASSGIRK